MGNRICRVRRGMVEERYTRPQRLIRQPSNVDYKKLRKLILSQKLAPCFDGAEDCSANSDLEECPICFYFYPSLNRSRCCTKGICTECFLQMQHSAAHPAQCPFCKTSSYAVDYRGAKTLEEKGLEQAEEQKVIEAKIRMLQESENTEQVHPAAQIVTPVIAQSPTMDSSEQPGGGPTDVGESDSSSVEDGGEDLGTTFLNDWNRRHAEFGLGLEDIMLMEAIWLSIKDNTTRKRSAYQSSGSNGIGGSQREPCHSNQIFSSFAMINQQEVPYAESVTGGVAVAIARLAERNILQSGSYNSFPDGGEMNETQDESYIEHHSHMLSTMPNGAHTLYMDPIGSPEDSDFDEEKSECYHLRSLSTTEDDSNWDSLSACILEGSEVSEDGFVMDEDQTMEDIDMTSSCSSSIHTVYDGSCGSPNCYEI